MEDLEEDRLLGPREASEACDLLSMHGYPIYADWADGPTDDATAPVPRPRDALARGRSRPPLQRVRSSHLPRGRPDGEAARRASSSPLIEEDAAAAYTARVWGASSRRLSRRDALVLFRLRPSALGEPAPRSRSPRAHLRALASRRLTETVGRGRGGVRRGGAGRPSRRLQVDRHRPNEFFSTRARSSPVCTAAIGST